MSLTTHDPAAAPALIRGTVITGLANAVVNGAIQAVLLAGQGPLALSADTISTEDHTVLGSAVLLATTLAMILTAITYLTLKGRKKAFFPDILWLTVKHGFLAFGIVVAAAVLWQRMAGTILVSVPVGVGVLALLAGLVAAAVHYATMRAGAEPGHDMDCPH